MNGAGTPTLGPSFGEVVSGVAARGGLVVQPRMGFSDPARMRDGLLAVRRAAVDSVGTITLDSYTRVGDHEGAAAAMAAGGRLNGYPLLHHPAGRTREMLEGVPGPGFPVQVRHGSALASEIVARLGPVGLDATEGGPVSYCLPYSRVGLARATTDWARSCELLARNERAHLESFGGCMLGQLCPPSLLIAITVLECLFFAQHGVRSVSLSYAQQTDPDQDAEALAALRRLGTELLGGVDHHVVVYAYMGVYPRTRHGALGLLRDASTLAVRGGAARLIVKTTAEAHRIPTVQENVEALEVAATAARAAPREAAAVPDTGLHDEARALVDAVRELSDDIGSALVEAFRRGVLDVPYCLHPDNRGATRSHVDPATGRLLWSRTGAMPIRAPVMAGRSWLTSGGLLAALNVMADRYDERGRAGVGVGAPAA